MLKVVEAPPALLCPCAFLAFDIEDAKSMGSPAWSNPKSLVLGIIEEAKYLVVAFVPHL